MRTILKLRANCTVSVNVCQLKKTWGATKTGLSDSVGFFILKIRQVFIGKDTKVKTVESNHKILRKTLIIKVLEQSYCGFIASMQHISTIENTD